MAIKQIIFDEAGNMRKYAPDKFNAYTPEYRDNVVFEATLKLEKTDGATYWFSDRKGHTFPMYRSEIDRMLKTVHAENGVIRGNWVGVKTGVVYSLRYEGPVDNWQGE